MRNSLFLIALLCAGTAVGDQNGRAPAGRVTGTVSASSGSTVTVSGLVINVAGASISSYAGKSIPVGSRVIISLRAAGVAGSVIVEPPLLLSGAVESVRPSSLSVLGTPVSVTESTTFGGWAGGVQLTKLSDLVQQQAVDVDAVTASDGSVTALRIWGLGPTPAAPGARPIDARTQIDGVVQSVDGNVYTVGSTHVITSAQTKLAPGITKGDKVHIVGMKASNKTVLAVSIEKR
ncbi:MAG: hypothetical protein QOE68_4818 [Thermoanaerobaculia bacterium]|nr:hypothetical protein [Thermoanaerobaculia bacterium]